MQLCIKHGDGEVVDKAWGDLVRRTTALQGMRSNLNMESSRWARANRRLKAINTLSLTLITQSCETYLIQNTRPELTEYGIFPLGAGQSTFKSDQYAIADADYPILRNLSYSEYAPGIDH